MMCCHIAALPDDVLGYVLSLVGFNGGFPSLLVCKRWHRLVFSDAAAQLWRSLDIELTAELLASPQRLASSRQLVQHTGPFAERAAVWARKVLNAAQGLPAAVPAVDSAGPSCTALIGHLSSASLRQLEVWLVPLPAAAVRALGRFSRLEALCLGHHKQVLSASAAEALPQLTALTSLELMGQSIASRVMHAVTRLARLRSLDLWSQQPLVQVDSLSALSGLTQLRLEHGPTWHNLDADLVPLPAAACFPGLARLDAASLEFQVHGQRIQVDNLVMAPLYRDRRSLPSISLACSSGHSSLTLRCVDLKQAGPLQALLGGLVPPAAHLHSLVLEECTILPPTSSGCGPLLASLAELELNNPLVWTGALADTPASLLQHTQQLKQLRLLGRGDDTGLEFPELEDNDNMLLGGLPPALAALAQLEALTVTGYWMTTLPDGPYLDSLKHLDLHDNRLERLPAALARATRLQQLRLGTNPLLLDSAAVRLLASLPALQRVELPAQAPDRLIKRLAASSRAPSLQIVIC